MVRKLFIFVFILSTKLLSGQVSVATYQAEIHTGNGKARSGVVELRFSTTKALFYHPSWPKETEYLANGSVTNVVIGDYEGMPVYTSLPEKIQISKGEYAATPENLFIFTDTIPKIDWHVLDKTKKIDGITAYAAEGYFGGRDYIAWFASEIPVPFGPYKFGGLPGLIVDIASADGLVKYRLLSLRHGIVDDTPMTPPKNGLYISEDDFRDHVIKRLIRVESLSTAEYQITNGSPDPNYDIEVNRWNIISKYKEQRGY